MVFLTATPHSGDDTAFHNLLGLLEPRFAKLAEIPEGNVRRSLREALSAHFVQRRRGDIAEWNDAAGFPERQSREATYRLGGAWGRLFDDVLTYARTMVKRAEGGTKLQQRMSWWAALALLRCISSSPAAASLALRTRLQAAENKNEQEQLADLDQVANETVMDEATDDSLSLNESVPAGTLGAPEDVETLRQLIKRADSLRGPRQDPKLQTLIDEVRQLILSGFSPVVFCRYIATAHYAGEELKRALATEKIHVIVVTGELTSDQREERIEALGELEDGVTPVLVATDCLSEGVNLQHFFNAVVHYDLTWNPTRHEQREGRADRFGQASKIVRALMLYGENNPVDGAVLRVILRKAEKIRKELGVAVPLPADNNKVVDAIMRAVLLHDAGASLSQQMALPLHVTDVEDELEEAWQTAQDKERATRTVFAQRRLRPDDVLPEWRKTLSVLGGPDDVARFVRLSSRTIWARRSTGTMAIAGCRSLTCHQPLQDRLSVHSALHQQQKIAFEQPAPAGAVYVHRAHPLVAALADYVSEQALDADRPEIGARAGAIFTHAKSIAGLSSTCFGCAVRFRSNNVTNTGSSRRSKSMLAEECLGVAVNGSAATQLLTQDDALSLLQLEPGRNMHDGQKSLLISQTLNSISVFGRHFQRASPANGQMNYCRTTAVSARQALPKGCATPLPRPCRSTRLGFTFSCRWRIYEVAMARTRRSHGFTALKVEGGILPPEFLQAIAELDAPRQTSSDYGISKSLAIKEELARYWRIASDLYLHLFRSLSP